MYEGNNSIALQSINWITNALLVLMEEQDYSKITIKDVCRKADLSRQTFYNFFNCKDEVLHYCIQRCFLENRIKRENRNVLYLNEITDAFFILFQKNAGLFQLIIDQHLEYILADEILIWTQNFVSQSTGFNESGNRKNSDYGTVFVTGGLTSILIYWFKNFQRVAPQDLSKLLFEIFTGDYYDKYINL